VRTSGATGQNQAFIDASAYYALVDTGDRNNAVARAIATRMGRTRWRLATTNLVLAETHALLLARLGRGIALRVLREIDRSSVVIARVGLDDEKRGRTILVRYDDKDFSLTDAISFAVMERLGIP
jgi:predicted nucleic acid-binding protein